MKELIIRQPDNFHVHLRRGSMLEKVIPFTSGIYKRAVIMGNLKPPIATAKDAIRYQEEIKSCPGTANDFEPIMTIMLIKNTTMNTIQKAYEAEIRVIKYIPGHTSTHSEEGITLPRLKHYYPLLKTAQSLGMIFSGHWELAADPTTGNIPHLNREEQAIPYLLNLVENIPGLKIIVEHVTTKKMIELIKNQVPELNITATITAHHPLLTVADVMRNKKIYNPFHYCLPIAKTEADRKAIIETMVGGHPKFFFGSDSAPYYTAKKKWGVSLPENKMPPAGIFTAPVELPILAQIFEDNQALDKLEDFTSRFGAQFYDLPLNSGSTILIKKKWRVPAEHEGITIFQGGKILNWQVA